MKNLTRAERALNAEFTRNINHSLTTKCNTCYGFGLWELGDHSPMGEMDAREGYSTIACTECGANENPRL